MEQGDSHLESHSADSSPIQLRSRRSTLRLEPEETLRSPRASLDLTSTLRRLGTADDDVIKGSLRRRPSTGLSTYGPTPTDDGKPSREDGLQVVYIECGQFPARLPLHLPVFSSFIFLLPLSFLLRALPSTGRGYGAMVAASHRVVGLLRRQGHRHHLPPGQPLQSPPHGGGATRRPAMCWRGCRTPSCRAR